MASITFSSDLRSLSLENEEATKDFLPKERTPDDFSRETGLPTKYRIRPRPSKAMYLKAQDEGVILFNPDLEKSYGCFGLQIFKSWSRQKILHSFLDGWISNKLQG